MASRLSRAILIAVGLAPFVATGCQGKAPPPAPYKAGDPARRSLPRPDEARDYLETVLKDKTRLIEVVVDQGSDGTLDTTGRSSLRKALSKWWQGAEAISRTTKPGEIPFRVTPDMTIRVFSPGSADLFLKGASMGQPDAQIKIYVSYRFSRILINDPVTPQFGEAIYVIHSTGPSDWVGRLFAGKL